VISAVQLSWVLALVCSATARRARRPTSIRSVRCSKTPLWGDSRISVRSDAQSPRYRTVTTQTYSIRRYPSPAVFASPAYPRTHAAVPCLLRCTVYTAIYRKTELLIGATQSLSTKGAKTVRSDRGLVSTDYGKSVETYDISQRDLVQSRSRQWFF